MYCKLIPQPCFNNDGRIYLLQFIPNNGFHDTLIGSNQYNGMNQKIANQYLNIPNSVVFHQQYFSSYNIPRTSRQKINLDQNAARFKEKFYSLFTYKKRIPKIFVFIIHNNIAAKLNLRCVAREEYRSVNKYFQNFSKNQKEIIEYLSSLSDEERNQLQTKSIGQCEKKSIK